jgi:hypothetical protein
LRHTKLILILDFGLAILDYKSRLCEAFSVFICSAVCGNEISPVLTLAPYFVGLYDYSYVITSDILFVSVGLLAPDY